MKVNIYKLMFDLSASIVKFNVSDITGLCIKTSMNFKLLYSLKSTFSNKDKL